MAALIHTSTLHFTIPKSPIKTLTPRPFPIQSTPNRHRQSLRRLSIKAYKVVIEHQGETTELEVEPDETILTKALESGLEVPYDCNLGVCMTCPAKLVEGKVDQSDGMLSDDVIERGYALMCAAYPRSDCRVKIIPEEELLSLQLATADD